MIDIKLLRENPGTVEDSIARRGLKIDINSLSSLDQKRIVLAQQAEALRAKLKPAGKPTDQELEALQATKKEFEKVSAELSTITVQYQDLLSQVPNFIAPNTPDGGEENNREEKNWGKPGLDFDAKDHVELADLHDLINFEAGAKVSGAKFYFLKTKAVLLWRAVSHLVEDILLDSGYELMMVPHMVSSSVAEGTGFLPKGEESQNYVDTKQDLVMIATAELPLTGYHKDDEIDVSKPLRYAGISPCYRLEAGAYGKFSSGLYRVHQFEKIEMYSYTSPSDSEAELEKILALEEKICQALEIPYRVVRIASGDLSAPAYKKYDIEYYSPVADQYRELTSCSDCTSYQARNLNIRYRNSDKKLDFVHTLNGTAATSSRTLIAILENHQQPDGSINLPTALQSYYGSEKL